MNRWEMNRAVAIELREIATALEEKYAGLDSEQFGLQTIGDSIAAIRFRANQLDPPYVARGQEDE